MFARLVSVLGLLATLGWSAAAQQPDKVDPKADPKAGEKAAGPVFELRLSDDTQMKVVLLDPTLSVSTRYGKLTIPAGEVRRLEFGFRYPEGLEAKILKAIDELGAPEFRDRETAEQFLGESGHFAVPALRRAVRSENPEVVRRAGAVLKAAESKLAPDKAELRDYDTIETTEFTAKGRIEASTLKVSTKFFGEATVKFTDIKSFRSMGSGGNSEFALDSALYARQTLTNWLETQVSVTSGQQLDISVSGQIDTWPQQPGQYMTGPSGMGGGIPPQPAVPGAGGAVRIGIPGQVIGRIGPNGTPFLVGAAYKAKATESGKLFLRIAPSAWGNDSAGSYKVKVTSE